MKRNKLISARKQLQMTQEEVAIKSGIQRSYYGLIENGLRNPTLHTAMKIAFALNVTIQDVFPEEIFFGNKCYELKQNQII